MVTALDRMSRSVFQSTNTANCFRRNVRERGEAMHEGFKLFVQLFSALVGAVAYIRLRSSFPTSFALLSDILRASSRSQEQTSRGTHLGLVRSPKEAVVGGR